jgi:hypothetical protein
MSSLLYSSISMAISLHFLFPRLYLHPVQWNHETISCGTTLWTPPFSVGKTYPCCAKFHQMLPRYFVKLSTVRLKKQAFSWSLLYTWGTRCDWIKVHFHCVFYSIRILLTEVELLSHKKHQLPSVPHAIRWTNTQPIFPDAHIIHKKNQMTVNLELVHSHEPTN